MIVSKPSGLTEAQIEVLHGWLTGEGRKLATKIMRGEVAHLAAEAGNNVVQNAKEFLASEGVPNGAMKSLRLAAEWQMCLDKLEELTVKPVNEIKVWTVSVRPIDQT